MFCNQALASAPCPDQVSEQEVLVQGKSRVKIFSADVTHLNSIERDKWPLVVVDLHEVIKLIEFVQTLQN